MRHEFEVRITTSTTECLHFHMLLGLLGPVATASSRVSVKEDEKIQQSHFCKTLVFQVIALRPASHISGISVCLSRERERERDRDRDRDRERQTDRQTDRRTDGQIDR